MQRTIDGIKKARKPAKIPETKNQIQKNPAVPRAQIAKPLNLITTVVVTFILTFALSLATSQILAARSGSNGEVLGASTLTKAPDDSVLSVSDQPQQNITFNNIVLTEPETVFLPNENVEVPDPLLHRKEFLKQYLDAKHSPLANHVDAISEQSQWKLIVAIAQAESSSCKKYPEKSANCWGIGGASNLMKFPDLDSAIAHVNGLLENKYISQGLTSPQKLSKKWVGHKSDQWEQAVQQELDNLEGVQ